MMQYDANHQRPQQQNKPRTPPPHRDPVNASENAAAAKNTSFPEVGRYMCHICHQTFSTEWVLTAHCEEVHRVLVPSQFLEEYVQQFNDENEKKKAVVKAATSSRINSQPRVATPTTMAAAASDASSRDNAARENLGASSTAPSNIQVMISQTMQNRMPLPQQLQLHSNNMQQHHLNPTPMLQMMCMGVPLGPNAFAPMYRPPPLVPLMMQPPSRGSMGQFGRQYQRPMMDMQQAIMAQKQLMQPQEVFNATPKQKHLGTQTSGDQKEMLLANFKMNEYPSAEQINEMVLQIGLPPKRIRRWFRDRRSIERQRNKDSPYNFNNPPTTRLNVEEYLKTGEVKFLPLNSSRSSTEEVTTSSTENEQALSEIKTEAKEDVMEDVVKHENENKNLI